MNENQSSYRQIFKATTIFGGVEFINILVKILKTKFIAVLLGADGMGISGLLISTRDMVRTITSFGLETSSVRNVANAQSGGNQAKVSAVVKILSRLVWATGFLGMIFLIILSPWLSELTFGNRNYTTDFILISITLLFLQLSAGQMVVLRGLRQIKFLAKASVMGSMAGLFLTIPLYYFYGLNGIVPGIILVAFSQLLLSWHYRRKIKLNPVKLSKSEAVSEGKDMMKLGFMLSLTGIYNTGISYTLKLFISNFGNVAQVGFYNAGMMLVNMYTGMVFTAMGKDFFPRLAAVGTDDDKARNLINHQAEMAVLILAPILVIFIGLCDWIIKLLLSAEFDVIIRMVQFAAIGIFFRAVSWANTTIIMARGDSSLFFWNEFFAGIVFITAQITGYYLNGLSGIGLAFCFSNVYYAVQTYLLTKHYYSFSLSGDLIKLFVIQLSLALMALFTILFLSKLWAMLSVALILLLSVYHSYRQIDKRIGFKKLITDLLHKNLNKK